MIDKKNWVRIISWHCPFKDVSLPKCVVDLCADYIYCNTVAWKHQIRGKFLGRGVERGWKGWGGVEGVEGGGRQECYLASECGHVRAKLGHHYVLRGWAAIIVTKVVWFDWISWRNVSFTYMYILYMQLFDTSNFIKLWLVRKIEVFFQCEYIKGTVLRNQTGVERDINGKVFFRIKPRAVYLFNLKGTGC